MKTLTVLATGLMQPDEISNGMRVAYERLRAASAHLWMHSWKEHRGVGKFAHDFEHFCYAPGDRIILVGHSFGVWYCTKLAAALAERDLPVYALASADGVNRPPRQPLVIPANVQRLYAWRQTQGVIKGSEIETHPDTQRVIDRIVSVGHARVDETPEFQDTIYRLAMGETE